MDNLQSPYFDKGLLVGSQSKAETVEQRCFRRSLERIDERDKLAKHFNVSTRLFVMRFNSDADKPDILLERRAKENLFAASVNKLAMAHYFVNNADYVNDTERLSEKIYEIQPNDIRPGNGNFDNPEIAGHIVSFSDLLSDMLGHSGNTATGILGMGIARDVNQHLEQSGFKDTCLAELNDGRFYLGSTNARNAAILMRDLVLAKGQIAEICQEALRNSLSPFFDRESKSGLLPANSQLFIKYGQYNGDKDVPYAIRHEVGALQEASGAITIYAIMTKYPKSSLFKIPRAFIAKTTIQNLEAEILFGFEREEMEIFISLGRLVMNYLNK